MYVTAGVWVVCVCATKVEVMIIIGGIYIRGSIYMYMYVRMKVLILLLMIYNVFFIIIIIGLT